jgi:hypothetical protein
MFLSLFVLGLLFLLLPLVFDNLIKHRSLLMFRKIEINDFNKIIQCTFLLIVVLTALIQTRAQTIQLLSLPLLAILIFKKQSTQFKHQISLVEIISVFTFSFLLFFVAFGFPQSTSDINLHYDIHYYAKLSQKIMEAHSENGGALLSSYIENKGITLYHFSDLWFTGFFAELFNISHFAVLSFFTYPLLLSMGIFSLKDFLIHIGFEASTFKNYLIIFLVLFGLSLPVCLFQNEFLELSYSRYLYSPGLDIYSTKTLILLPLITLAMRSLILKDYLSFITLILLATISYSTTLIFLSCILLFVLLYKLWVDIKAKNWNNPTNFYLVSMVGSFYILLLFILIYWVDFSVLPSSASELSLKSIIVLFIEYNLSPLLVYSIPLLFILTIKSKEKKWFATKLTTLLVLSISFTSLYVVKQTGEQNAVQALINSMPFIFILITLFVYQSSEKIYRIILVGIFSLSTLYNITNHTMQNKSFNEEEKKIQTILQNENSPQKWAVIDTCLTQNKFYKFNQLGSFLFYSQNLDYPVDLSNFFILKKEDIYKLPAINTGPIEQNFLKCKNLSKDSVFREFIFKNEISFILSRNKSANRILKDFSINEGLFKLKYSGGGLELWVVKNI